VSFPAEIFASQFAQLACSQRGCFANSAWQTWYTTEPANKKPVTKGQSWGRWHRSRRSGHGEGERLLPPTASCTASCYTDATDAEMQLWDNFAKIPINKISRMLGSTPPHQGPVPTKGCDWCPQT